MKNSKNGILIIVFFMLNVIISASTIEIATPNGGEVVKGIKYIMWNNSLDVEMVKLDYKLRDSDSWHEIDTNLNANYGYYPWDTSTLLSDGKNGEVKIKITALKNKSGEDIVGVNDESDAGFTLENYNPVLLNPSSTSPSIDWTNNVTISFLVENGAKINKEDISILLNEEDKTEFAIGGQDESNPKLFIYTFDTVAATGGNVSGNGSYTLKIKVANYGDSENSIVSQTDAIKIKNVYFNNINTSSILSGTKSVTWNGAEATADTYEIQYSINNSDWEKIGNSSTDGTLDIDTNKIEQNPIAQDTGNQNVKLKLIAKNNNGFYATTESELFKVKHRPVIDASTIVIADNTVGINGISQNATITWQATDPDNDTMKFKIEYKTEVGEYTVFPFFSSGFIGTGTTNANGTLIDLGGGNYSFEFDSTKYTSDEYLIRITAQDTDSLSSSSPYISESKEISSAFTIDHKPIITNISVNGIANGGIISGNTGNKKELKFTIQHSDDTTGDIKLSYLIEFYDKVAEEWRTFSEFREEVNNYESSEKYLKLSESSNLSEADTLYTSGNIITYDFDPNEIQHFANTAEVKFRVKSKYERETEAFEYMDDYEMGSDLFKIEHKAEITGITISDNVTLPNINGNAVIKWQASDPDNDNMRFKVSYQKSGGTYTQFNFFDTFKEATGGTNLILNGSDYEFSFDTDELETGTYNIKVEVQEVEDGKIYTYDVYTTLSEKTDVVVDHKPVILDGTIEVKSLTGASISVISGNSSHQKRIEWNVRQPDTLTDDTVIGYIVEYYDNSEWKLFSDFSSDNDYKKVGEANIEKSGVGNYTDITGIKMRYTFDPNEISDSNNIANVKFRVKARYFRAFNSVIYNEDGNYLNESEIIEESENYKVSHKPTLDWDIKTKDNSGQSLKNGSTQTSGMNYWTDPNAYINWTVSDPDGDDLTVIVTYESTTKGTAQIHTKSYSLSTENEIKTGNTSWDTSSLIDSRDYIVKIELKDGSQWTNDLKITENTSEFVVDNANKPTIEIISTPEKKDLSLDYISIFGYPDNDIVWGKSGADRGETGAIKKEVKFDVTNNDLRDYSTINYNIYFYNETISSPTVLRTETGVIVSGETKEESTNIDISSATDGEYYIKIEADTANESIITTGDDKAEAITEKITILNNSPYFKNIDGESKKAIVTKKGGLIEIEWSADDPNNDLDNFNIYYKKGTDIEWSTDDKIVTNLTKSYAEDGSNYKYVWGLSEKGLESDTYYDVRIVASNGSQKRYLDVENAFIIRFKPLVTLLSPSNNEEFNGTKFITWKVDDPNNADIKNIKIEISDDNGITWNNLKEYTTKAEVIAANGKYTFDTQTKVEGNYKIRVIAVNDQGEDEYHSKATEATLNYTPAYSEDNYTANIEIKHKPELNIIYPVNSQDESLSGNKTFIWNASDPDNDKLKLDIKYSIDNGITWSYLKDISTNELKEIAGDLSMITINTREIPDSNNVQIKFEITDNTTNGGMITKTITGLTSAHKPIFNVLNPVLNPKKGDILSGIKVFSWQVTDPDRDELKIAIKYSADNGEWIDLEDISGNKTNDLDNTGSIAINTKIISESENIKIKIIATDTTIEDGITYHEVTNLKSEHKAKVSFIEPLADEIYKRNVAIRWLVDDPDGDVVSEYSVEYIDESSTEGRELNITNGGIIPEEILKSIELDENGQFKIVLKITTDPNEGEITKNIKVTLDRSPEIYMLIPVKDQLIKDEMKINWRATNPNGDSNSINEDMKIKIYYSVDGGAIWNLLYKDLTQTKNLKVENTDDKYEYIFDTRNGNAEEKIQTHIDKGFGGIPDSKNVKLKVVVTDKTNSKFTSEAETDLFTIANYIPIINLVEPGKGVLWYGKRDIRWEATSNTGKIEDDKALKIEIKYSKKVENSESGDEEIKNWKEVASRTFNDGIYTWDTEKVQDGKYYIKVEATNNSGTGSEKFKNPVEINNGEIDLMADEFFNYPNPFKSSTTFKYILPNDMRSVRIDIYTSQGQKIDTVYDLPNLSGIYNYGWVASGYANGAYFARLVALGYDGEEYVKINKMAILK